jgi:2-iminoacetate synthase ThiH
MTGRRLGITDAFERPLRNLRISVTDRCNLRCHYCMPEEEYAWLPRQDLLTFEEISTLVDVFATLGVEKVRLTGGSRCCAVTYQRWYVCWRVILACRIWP